MLDSVRASLRAIPPPLWTLFCFVGFILTTKYLLEVYIGMDDSAILVYLKDLIRTYGYPLSFAGAFLEGLLLVGMYFPGSFVIFLTIIVAETPLQAVVSVLLVTSALYMAYALNYILGKYGWYTLLTKYGLTYLLEDARSKLESHHVKAIFMSYWQPGLASLTATAAGVLHLKPWFFFPTSLLALALWNSFWGVLAYTFGEKVITMVFSPYFLIPAALVYVAVSMYEDRYAEAKKNSQG